RRARRSLRARLPRVRDRRRRGATCRARRRHRRRALRFAAPDPDRGRDRPTATRPPMGGAMSEPRIAIRLNHVAYPTIDTPATVRFYTEVMGFRLVVAPDAESQPEGASRR